MLSCTAQFADADSAWLHVTQAGAVQAPLHHTRPCYLTYSMLCRPTTTGPPLLPVLAQCTCREPHSNALPLIAGPEAQGGAWPVQRTTTVPAGPQHFKRCRQVLSCHIFDQSKRHSIPCPPCGEPASSTPSAVQGHDEVAGQQRFPARTHSHCHVQRGCATSSIPSHSPGRAPPSAGPRMVWRRLASGRQSSAWKRLCL